MSKSLVLILFLVKCSFASYSTKDLLQVALNPRNFIQSLNLDGNKNIKMCEFHLDLYHNQLQNPEDLFMNPWALKMLDASAKFPDGLLTSNFRFPGNMYECMDVSVDHLTDSNGSYVPGFKGKYFNFYFFPTGEGGSRMAISLPGFDVSTGGLPLIKAGLCLPSSCNFEEIPYLFLPNNDKIVLIPAMSRWQDQEMVFSNQDQGFIALCSIILICILIGTSIEAWMIWKLEPNEEKSSYQKFFLNFGLHNNTKRLFDTTPPNGNDHISCLDGIRFISMTWVVLGHVLMQVQSELPTNSVPTLFKKFESFWFQPIDNALPSVDTFFLLSGLLVCYLMLKELDKTKGWINWPIMYLHRYLRLTGIYAFILFFMVSLWEHLGIGPGHSNRLEVENCRKVAWQNLLYINNFFPGVYTEDKGDEYPCMGETWYLANDMQFFVVAPIIVYLIWKIKNIGLVVAGLLALLSALVPAGLTYKNGWGAQSGLEGVVPESEIEKDYFNWNYIKPWCRFSPYIVGILLGYLLHITKKKPLKMHRVVAIWGWLIAFGTGFAVIYGLNIPKRYFEGEPLSEAANIIYGGFHRLAWAMAVGWVVFACARGYGGWINTFLSWNAFKPLSRISFIIYLVHIRMESLVIGMYPSVLSINVTLAVIFFLAVLGYSAIVSALLFIFVELPWLNTEKFIFGLLLKKKKQSV